MEESAVNRRFSKWFAALLIALLALNGFALAQGAISTTVVMRVSHMTQNAVVDAGEDLTIEVNIDGVTPDTYQWYFNDAPIEGADHRFQNPAHMETANKAILSFFAL